MHRRGWIALTVCLVLLGWPTQQARAQFGFGLGATEITQLLNHAQLAMSYIQEAQTALNAIQMAQMMVIEGQQLVQHPTTSITVDLLALANILQQAQGLAGDMAQMDATFQNVYAPYSPTPLVTFASAYGGCVNTTLNTIHGSLNAAGYQSSMLNNEQNFMQTIQAMMQTPEGRDQALQLGNVIGTEEVAQLQKLRQLMIADMSAKQAFTAQQNLQQQAQQNVQQNAFTHANWTADQRGW